MHPPKKITSICVLVTFLFFSFSSCHKKASASFAYNISENGMVTFTNTSSYSNEYVWDFGDSTKSEDFSPVHIYSQNGTFTVTLNARTGKSITQKSSTSTESQVITIKNVNYFMCDISGYGSFSFTGTLVKYDNYGGVEISAFDKSEHYGKKLIIRMPFVTTGNTPDLNKDLFIDSGMVSYAYFKEAYNTMTEYDANGSHLNSSGMINFQQYDSAYMKGIFEFKAFKGTTDSVVVTNGLFSFTF